MHPGEFHSKEVVVYGELGLREDHRISIRCQTGFKFLEVYLGQKTNFLRVLEIKSFFHMALEVYKIGQQHIRESRNRPMYI